MTRGYRRSSTFGIVGVIVVMVACAVIGLQFGSGAHPTGSGFDWLCDLWLAERLADAVRA